MKTIKGPAIFLAQFAGNGPHLQNFNDMAKWAKECGFIGVQLPSWDGRVMDLAKAAESKTYCDELKGVAAKHGIEITELAAHLQGQLVAVHPAYDLQFDNFAPKEVHGNPGKAPGLGGRADEAGREGQQESRAQECRRVSGRACVALSISVAAATAGADRCRIR